MPAIHANQFWYDQIGIYMQKTGVPYHEAELAFFAHTFQGMRKEGQTIEQVRQFFEQTYNIKYSAFYNRVRKCRQQIPLH